MSAIENVLERIKKMKYDPQCFTQFNLPAVNEKITRFESSFRVRLPLSFKKFLLRYNGGMMVCGYQGEFPLKKKDYEIYRTDSVYFLSIEEITERYSDLRSRGWKISSERACPYPVIPFCALPNNEILVFINGSRSGDESPVFDAFHEVFPSEWGIVAPDFTTFLSDYLDAPDHPVTLGDEDVGVAEDYIDKSKVLDEAAREKLSVPETDQDMEGSDAFALYERAREFRDSGNMAEAYRLISRAILLEEKDPFYHYIRGSLLNDAGEYRAALIDHDIAVKMKPDDTFFIYCRAEALFHLNRLPEALADCMKIIGLEEKNLIAYMLRRDVYEAMGNDDKAREDQSVIDSLRQG